MSLCFLWSSPHILTVEMDTVVHARYTSSKFLCSILLIDFVLKRNRKIDALDHLPRSSVPFIYPLNHCSHTNIRKVLPSQFIMHTFRQSPPKPQTIKLKFIKTTMESDYQQRGMK